MEPLTDKLLHLCENSVGEIVANGHKITGSKSIENSGHPRGLDKQLLNLWEADQKVAGARQMVVAIRGY